MRYLLPLLLALLLVGCASQNEVVYRAEGAGPLGVAYIDADDNIIEIDVVGTFEQSVILPAGVAPQLIVSLQSIETGLVSCEIIVNGETVSSQSDTAQFAGVHCQ